MDAPMDVGVVLFIAVDHGLDDLARTLGAGRVVKIN